MTDLLLHNARILDPAQGLDVKGFIAIKDGVISACSGGEPDAEVKSAASVIDCAGACLAPGIVDMRVQSADPGNEHLEDLTTLLHAAVAGGITSVISLPDAQPVIDDASMIDSLTLRAMRIGGARLYLYGAATKNFKARLWLSLA